MWSWLFAWQTDDCSGGALKQTPVHRTTHPAIKINGDGLASFMIGEILLDGNEKKHTLTMYQNKFRID